MPQCSDSTILSAASFAASLAFAGSTLFSSAFAQAVPAPTIDAKRHVVYAATGNMYTEPQQPTSDSIMAFDLDTGVVNRL